MAAARKLQSEIQQVLKKIEEGVEIFDETMAKVYESETQTLKEKFEADLKKEIKKLQRLRDQVKTWLSSNEIKDKAPLTEAKKVIESKMEAFKVCEKDTKTKAYSKEGLAREAKLDPKEAAREEKRNWLNDCLEQLNDLINTVETEKEKLSNSTKKGKNKDLAANLEKYDNRIQKHKFHIQKIELILRLLDGEELDPSTLDTIKDSLEYYLETAAEDDGALGVEHEFDIYEDLDLDSYNVTSHPYDNSPRLPGHENDGELPAGQLPTAANPAGAPAAAAGTTPATVAATPATTNATTGAGGKDSKDTATTSTAKDSKADSKDSHNNAKDSHGKNTKNDDKEHPATPVVVTTLPPVKILPPSLAKTTQKGVNMASIVAGHTNTTATTAAVAGDKHQTTAPVVPAAPILTSPPPPGVKPQQPTAAQIAAGGLHATEKQNQPSPAQPSQREPPGHAPQLEKPTLAAVLQQQQHHQQQQPPAPPIMSPPVANPIVAAAALNAITTPPPVLTTPNTVPVPPQLAPPVTLPPQQQQQQQPPVQQQQAHPNLLADEFEKLQLSRNVSTTSNQNTNIPQPVQQQQPQQQSQLQQQQPPVTMTPGGLGQKVTSPPQPAIQPVNVAVLQAGLKANNPSPTKLPQSLPGTFPSGVNSNPSSGATTVTDISPPSVNLGGIIGNPSPSPLGGLVSSASSSAPGGPVNQSQAASQMPPGFTPEMMATLALLKQSASCMPDIDNEKTMPYVPRNYYNTHPLFPTQPLYSNNECTPLFDKLSLDTFFFCFYFQQGSYQQYLAAKKLKKGSWRFHKKYTTWFQRHNEPKIATKDYEEGTYLYFDFESGWCNRIKTEFKFEYAFLEDEVNI